MNTYLLIHGAWHGAWCWDKIIPLLEAQGHTVIAPELPGHGKNNSPSKDVSLQSYTNCICDILDTLNKPAILVGHSMAGLIISQVAAYRPEKIKALIYVTAFVLENQGSLFSFIKRGSKLFLDFNTESSTIVLNTTAITNAFYGDCTAEDIARAKALITAQPIAPFKSKLNINNTDFKQIPKTYIECLNDNIIPIAMQRKMHTKFNWKNVHTLNSSHSPFLSCPKALTLAITA